MKINNNISAVITNNRLLSNENSIAASMEKLASGLKINHAKDAPSGIAISKKMRAQIEGLDKASQNASDGVSVAQTADGALGEVTSLLQRMRELAVQAANGTNTVSDKQSIQSEIESLKEEIDRISSSTEFNTKSLLNGSLDARVYGENVSRAQASSYTPAGEYKLTVTTVATQASTAAANAMGAGSIDATQAGTIKINGATVDITEGMTATEVYNAIRDTAEIGECHISDTGAILTITSDAYGSDGQVMVEVDNANLLDFIGFTTAPTLAVGTDAAITLDKTNSDFGNQASYVTDGNRVTVTDTNGFELSFLLDEKFKGGDIELEVTDVGPMDVQIGANEGQYMTIRIPACDCKSLYIDNVDVSTVNGAQNALESFDYALDRINAARSNLGAFQNRLETSVESLDETSENMTSALSRIEDVDMAGEMVKYTSYNVIAQAATSALSQANELPQLALQLLQ